MSSITFAETNQTPSFSWGDALQDDSETNIPDPESVLMEKFQGILSRSLAPFVDELATVRHMVEHLQQSVDDAINANQQTAGNDWGTEIPESVDALNWIVEKIRETGSNSILPARLGLNWKSEFPTIEPRWVAEKKTNGRKKGVKAFVTEYGNGILSVETTDHVKAKILLNP